MRAEPLPPEITKLLEENTSLLKLLDQTFNSRHSGETEDALTPETVDSLEKLKNNLNVLFESAGPEWAGAVDNIWSFGPRRCGPNILLNRVSTYKRPSLWSAKSTDFKLDSPHFNYDSTFIGGFQLATLSGPLCDEPIMGVCFVVEEWTFEKEPTSINAEDSEVLSGTEIRNVLSTNEVESESASEVSSVISSGPSSASSTPFGPFTGQIMSTVKEACRKAFQVKPQRLMSAMYSCNIQVTTDMLGKCFNIFITK